MQAPSCSGWGGGGGVTGGHETYGLLSFISSESPRLAEVTHACLLADATCCRGKLVHADLDASSRRVPRQVEHCINTDRPDTTETAFKLR